MPNQNNTRKPNPINKDYFPLLCLTNEFFVPHKDANHLNAQDVVVDLVNSAKNISIATWNCFEDGEKLVMKGEIVANLIFEIQTKLEMIEKILPLAFDDNKGE
ncbi:MULTISPECIES: hypothetical protein [Acinetobacter calcoaceticus/baumannii complex]|uniref:hypothetical protein n=1 Tax=Acinetobacter calcoaceticus/baumannii complex TaxID=909768 RepID=UPI0004477D53|nr:MULTISPECIES: hypothetical protein [Acinetobacter calcoaceticus/baumannii complex]EXE78011.1 hypothetical protein J582_1487 [Acinetobacter sp. 1566109]MBR7750616.1 hypothetical protein [Acinetobacter nosocomialis]